MMNPYTLRGWHLPGAYGDTTNCDRNYPMYPTSWPSGYFSSPPSVYPFQPESKSHNANDWKLQSICSTTADTSSGQRDANGLMKPGYESLLYKPNNVRCTELECVRDDPQRSSCAMSCTCSGQQQRLNVIDNSWRNQEVPGALDFNKAQGMSPYQSFCNRGKEGTFLFFILFFPFFSFKKKKRTH